MFKLLYADEEGNLYEDPELSAAAWDGARTVPLARFDPIPLPEGADLMLLPGRRPVAWDASSGRAVRDAGERRGGGLYAVAAVLPAGFTRTGLPAYQAEKGARRLPLYGYTAVGAGKGTLYVAALETDEAFKWNPALYNDPTLPGRIKGLRKRFPVNRLVEHLARCALEYRCLTAQNLFYRRWEAGIPVAVGCNAACLGCISLQKSECCPSSQERIAFVPSVAEVVELAVPHLEEAVEPIVSFGQGCEGEPLTQADVLAQSIREIRRRTGKGTINVNTNAGDTRALARVIEAGLDSVRVSMISAREEVYKAYHRPGGFTLDNVLASLAEAKRGGVYVSINLLVLPGLTDRDEEVDALDGLIGRGLVDMVQLRNLNIDPAYLFARLPGRKGELLGIRELIRRLKAIPGLTVGNYTKEVSRNGIVR
ncbi:radical SAM protein [Desulforudis sp. DRI-14]|uniref:radical SAM protein n=1 Tax=Desulforudis sp. DRI-14 TaxID=3459793 RepID=UPI0040423D2F